MEPRQQHPFDRSLTGGVSCSQTRTRLISKGSLEKGQVTSAAVESDLQLARCGHGRAYSRSHAESGNCRAQRARRHGVRNVAPVQIEHRT